MEWKVVFNPILFFFIVKQYIENNLQNLKISQKADDFCFIAANKCRSLQLQGAKSVTAGPVIYKQAYTINTQTVLQMVINEQLMNTSFLKCTVNEVIDGRQPDFYITTFHEDSSSVFIFKNDETITPSLRLTAQLHVPPSKF